MKEIELTKQDLQKNYQCFNHCLFHSDHGTIYKNAHLSPNCPSHLGERVVFVSNLECKEGYTYPLSALYDQGKIYGYEMPYLEKYQTFEQLVAVPNMIMNSCLSFEDKKAILLRLHQCLKNINREYIVGDIRLNNLMISKKGDAQIIDWENGSPRNQNFDIYALYTVFGPYNTLLDDAVKMFISTISLLYNINFEELVINESFYVLMDISFDDPIKEYINTILGESLSGLVIYFDEYLKYLKEPSTMRLRKMKKQVDSYLSF